MSGDTAGWGESVPLGDTAGWGEPVSLALVSGSLRKVRRES